MHDIIGVLGGTLYSRLWAAAPNPFPTQGDLGAYQDLRSPFPPPPPAPCQGSPTPSLSQAYRDCPSPARLAHHQISSRRGLAAQTWNLVGAQCPLIVHLLVCLSHEGVTLRARIISSSFLYPLVSDE